MWLKAEITGLLIGLVAVVFYLIIIFCWPSLPESFQTHFYGGEPGAMVVGLALTVGLISSILYLVNMVRKKWKMWFLRLIGFLALYSGFAVIGAMGI